MTNNQKRLSAVSAFVLALLGCGCIFKWGFASWQFLVPSVLALIPIVFLFIDACRECASCDSNDNKRYRLIMGILTLLIIAVLIASIVAQARSHSAKTPSSNNEGSTIVDADGSDNAGDSDGNTDEGQDQDSEPTSVDAESVSKNDTFEDKDGNTFRSTGNSDEDTFEGISTEDEQPVNLAQARAEMDWSVDLTDNAMSAMFGDVLKNRKFIPYSMPDYAEKRADITKTNDGISLKFKTYKEGVDPETVFDEYCDELRNNFAIGYNAVTRLCSVDFIAKENPDLVAIKKWMTKQYKKAIEFDKKHPGKKNSYGNNSFVAKGKNSNFKGYENVIVSKKYAIAAAKIEMALRALYTPEEIKVVSSKEYNTHLVDTSDPVLVRTKKTTEATKLSLVLRRRYLDDANGKVVDSFAIRICDKGIMDINPVVRVKKKAVKKVNNTPVNPGGSGNDKDTSSNPPSNPQGQGDDNDRRTDGDDRSDRTGDDEDRRTDREDKPDKPGKDKDTSSDETKKDDKGKGGKDSNSQSNATQKADKGAGKDSNSQSNATQKGDKNKGQDSGTSADPVNRPDKQKHSNPKQEGDSKSETDTRTDVNASGVGDSNKGTGNKDGNQSQSIKEEIDIPANNQVDKTQNEQQNNSNGNNSIKENIPYVDTSTGESKNDQHTSINDKPVKGGEVKPDHSNEPIKQNPPEGDSSSGGDTQQNAKDQYSKPGTTFDENADF